MLDFTVYNLIYVDNILIRIFGFSIVACFAFFLYLFAFVSASMYASAHSPYARLNSLMFDVKFVSLNYRQKWKIVNLIERLGGRPIAVYCLDLFALNNYEFYQFVSTVFVTYFLIVSLINKLNF